jgi:hypothetical protein
MPYSHNKINELEGGWYVVFNDGNVIVEDEMPWIKVPNKKDIKIMGLKWRNKHYELEGKDNYVPPGETHLRQLNISSRSEGEIAQTTSTLVGRFIGYYEEDHKVIIRVVENTGQFLIQNVPYSDN